VDRKECGGTPAGREGKFREPGFCKNPVPEPSGKNFHMASGRVNRVSNVGQSRVQRGTPACESRVAGPRHANCCRARLAVALFLVCSGNHKRTWREFDLQWQDGSVCRDRPACLPCLGAPRRPSGTRFLCGGRDGHPARRGVPDPSGKSRVLRGTNIAGDGSRYRASNW
jgi:hypothetical protein